MKKPELLAPAGNKEALIAAVEAGADAVYLSGNMFGARSYANNFDYDGLKEAVDYTHKYGVKIYITTNTLIFENEIEAFMKYIGYLNEIGVDAVIMQDLGMMEKVRQEFPDLEVHASTQMHVHNKEGVKFVEKMGLTRAVLARETDYETIKDIKDNTNIELEIFVHGALCICYSGQCLMSSLIGHRSGNRGTCAGSCRQKYDVLDENLDKKNIEKYNLSTRDLNSLNDLEKLIETGADSFKIEGRMKSPEYVYLVVKLYREAIDSYFETGKVNVDELLFEDLKKTFNRMFTKGFLFNAKNEEIINPMRPNHLGINIGEVIEVKNDFVNIKLIEELNINDGIRILGNEDTGFIVTSMFKNRERIQTGSKGDIISIPVKNKTIEGGSVYKTLDFKTNKRVNERLNKLERKVTIDGEITLKEDECPILTITDGVNNIEVKGNNIAQHPINLPTDVNRIKEQILKTGDSVFKFNNLNINCEKGIFIPIKDINELRRNALELLLEKRIEVKVGKKCDYKNLDIKDFEKEQNQNCIIRKKEQLELAQDRNCKFIYAEDDVFNEIQCDNKILKLGRVMDSYKSTDKCVLIGEVGSLMQYTDFHTDYSFNVTNSYTLALLHYLGSKKVTLSLELEDKQMFDIIKGYQKRYNKNPNVEAVVYGKEEIMITKFNLLKYYEIQKNGFLVDRFNNKYIIVEKNKLTHIYNYSCRYRSEFEDLFKNGINNIRFDYVDE